MGSGALVQRRQSREYADEEEFAMHISGRHGIDTYMGKPGQAFPAKFEKDAAVFSAAYGLTKVLSKAGIPTVMTNFRGIHQAGPDPQVGLIGPTPGLDIAGDFHRHWTDFAEMWQSRAIGSGEMYACFQEVSEVLVANKSNSKGLQEAYDLIAGWNREKFHIKGLSVNFHVVAYLDNSGLMGMFFSSTVVEGNVFFLSVTPWEANAPAFGGTLADLEVKVNVGTSKPAIWRVGTVWEGHDKAKDIARQSSQSSADAASI